jgi:amidase
MLPSLFTSLHMATESPDQSKLISMQNNDTPPDFLAKAILAIRNAAGLENIDRALKKHGLDVIIAPTDSPITTVAALAGRPSLSPKREYKDTDLAGYPIGTVPLGYSEESGRPFGLDIVGTANSEAVILGVMNAWEAADPQRRRPPPLLENWESKL